MTRALVTGGSGGIGSAICQRLAGDGLHVLVHANRNLELAQTLVEQLRQQGGSAEAVAFDVTDGSACEQALAGIVEQGPVQILVNNAGIHDDAPLAGMKPEQWRKVIDVSLHGFYNVTQPLLLPMMRTRWGRIVSMTSVAAVLGNRGQANYAAAKAGLHGATKSLAREIASRGVTVNAVAPGVIQTAMTEEVFSAEHIKAVVPMQRAGSAQEVAHLVGFLASEQAGYITGQVISINGGMG